MQFWMQRRKVKEENLPKFGHKGPLESAGPPCSSSTTSTASAASQFISASFRHGLSRATQFFSLWVQFQGRHFESAVWPMSTKLGRRSAELGKDRESLNGAVKAFFTPLGNSSLSDCREKRIYTEILTFSFVRSSRRRRTGRRRSRRVSEKCVGGGGRKCNLPEYFRVRAAVAAAVWMPCFTGKNTERTHCIALDCRHH